MPPANKQNRPWAFTAASRRGVKTKETAQIPPPDDEMDVQRGETGSEDDGVVTGKLEDLGKDQDDFSGEDADMENEDVEEEEEEEKEEEEESDDDLEGLERPQKAKSKLKVVDPASFATAMTSILGSHLKPADRAAPILARSKGMERKLAEEKMERKVAKALVAEKKKLSERDRVKLDWSNIEYEKRLRKVATRGVVKLFNAVRVQQRITDEVVTAATSKSKTLGAMEKAKNVSTMSKSSFLDLLKDKSAVSVVSAK